MKCTQCGSKIKGNVCPTCGAQAPYQGNEATKKHKKPFYRRWWFILLVIIAVITAAFSILTMDEKIAWDEIILCDTLPEPPAKRGEIHSNSSEDLRLEIEKISDKQYADYIEKCKAEGFTVEAETVASSFNAYNADGYQLRLSHYNETLSITLEKPMEMSKIKWPESTAGNQLPEPKSSTGKFSYEKDDKFFVYIAETSKADYDEYVEACADKGFDVDYDKTEKSYTADNNDGWHIRICYEGNNVMSIHIEATSKKTGNNEAEVPYEDDEDEKPDENNDIDTDTNNLSSDFKTAMDSYESFMNDYVDFMKKYTENPGDISLLADYAEYMKEYADFVKDFEKWENEDLSTEETAYYIEVQTRINKKLLEITE